MYSGYFAFGLLAIIFVVIHYFFISDMIREGKKNKYDDKSGKG